MKRKELKINALNKRYFNYPAMAFFQEELSGYVFLAMLLLIMIYTH